MDTRSYPASFLALYLILLLSSMATGMYKCSVKDFIRLGNSCYFISSEIATWQESHFRCRDHQAQLAVLATQYEDKTLQRYLQRSEFAQLGRWIGGMWIQNGWVWAAQGSEIDNGVYNPFASEDARNISAGSNAHQPWMCLYMNPTKNYLWSAESCFQQMHYICEAPLKRVSNGKLELEYEDQPEVPIIEEKTTTTTDTPISEEDDSGSQSSEETSVSDSSES